MFRCERCGSSYSATHAVTLENCPRCQVRDKVSEPLAFKAFTLPGEAKPAAAPVNEAEAPAKQNGGVSTLP